jgi:hypothetical protein
VDANRCPQIWTVGSGTGGCDGARGALQLGDRRCSLRGGEVAGGEVDAVAGGSGFAGEGWNGSRGSGELTGRLPAARTRPETRERRRGGTSGASSNSDEEFRPARGGLGRAKAWPSCGRVRGTIRTKAGATGRLIRPVTVRARRAGAAEPR